MTTPQPQSRATPTEAPRHIPTLQELQAFLQESQRQRAENEVYLRELGEQVDEFERQIMGVQGESSQS